MKFWCRSPFVVLLLDDSLEDDLGESADDRVARMGSLTTVVDELLPGLVEDAIEGAMPSEV